MRKSVLLFLTLVILPLSAAGAPLERATFAGGCFWCMEPPFDALPGVVSTTPGYTGGWKEHPTYQEVSAGVTGHAEAIQIVFDPEKVSYEKLLDVFWRNVDPVDADGQFCDRGNQYRSAIFHHGEAQRKTALESLQRVGKMRPWKVATQVTAATTFYPAEEYHQDYYRKNPLRYKFYRLNCGRDARLRQIWGESTH